MKTLIECSACGRQVSPAAANCPQCGHPIAKPKPKQTATGLLAAIIIALIVGGVLYFAITGAHI